MKSKQLAHVLIKVLGLYICLLAIPGILSGILTVTLAQWADIGKDRASGMLNYSIGDAMQAAVGIIIIVKSRKIAEFWFKNEDE